MSRPEIHRRARLLRVLLGTGLLLGAIFSVTPLIEYHDGLDSDGLFYAQMAGKSVEIVAGRDFAPWCWRLLTPFLVSLLPLPVLEGFRLLAFLSCWVNLLLLYVLLRRNDFDATLSNLGVMLFAGVFWATKFPFYSPVYIDYQTTTFVLVTLLWVTIGRFGWVLPWLVLGALQKESMVFMAPVAWAPYGQLQGWGNRRTWAYGLGLVSLPTLTIFAVRSAIEPTNDYSSTIALSHLLQLARPEIWPRFALAVASGLGLLPGILLIRWRAAARFLASGAHWVVLFVLGLGLLFGGVDKARLFLFALPAWVGCSVAVLSQLRREGRRGFGIWVAVTLAAHFYLGHHLSPMGTFEEYLARMVPIHAPGLSYLPHLKRVLAVFALWGGMTALWLFWTWKNGAREAPRQGDP